MTFHHITSLKIDKKRFCCIHEKKNLIGKKKTQMYISGSYSST